VVTVDGSGSTWTNSGELYVGGYNTAGGDGTLTVTNDGRVNVGGTLRVYSTGTVALLGGEITTGTVELLGTLAGNGSVIGNVVSSGGEISPGTSIGTLAVTGDLTFDAASQLKIELGSQSLYDRLTVSGAAALDGTLIISSVAGFNPNVADEFAILTCGSRTGQFAAATGLDHVGGYAGLELRLDYHAAGVRLTVWAMPGDANTNGFVDDDDLAILLANWEQDAGTITTWALGDFTADTNVDDDDLAVLLANWTGPPPPGGAAAPEPATLSLLALGGLAVMRRRRG